MKTKNQEMSNQKEITIHCGKRTNSFEELKSLCEKHSNELKHQLDIPAQSKVTVVFWTESISELICIGTFEKDSSGEVVYKLDYSQTTL